MFNAEIDWFWFTIMLFTYLNYWCIDQLLERWLDHKKEMFKLSIEGE